MHRYFYNWLLLLGAVHCVLGLIFIFLAQTSLIDPYLNYLLVVFDVELNASQENLLRVFLQFLGPTIASWGLMFYISVRFYGRYGTSTDKWLIIAAVLVWFISDTAISFMNGITAHIMINSLVMIFTVPVLLLMKPEGLKRELLKV